jgi:hypothetical protein
LSNHDEVRGRLREQADREWPEAWKPRQPGDEIVGTVTAIRPAVGTAYGPVPVIELAELGTGRPVAWWLIHTVARNEAARVRPALGESILVRYLGRVQPDGGGPSYASYKLAVDRPDEGSEIDWSAIAEPEDVHGAEPAPAAPAEVLTTSDGDIPF